MIYSLFRRFSLFGKMVVKIFVEEGFKLIFFNWLFIVALTARSYRDCHWFSVWEWCFLWIY